MAALTGESQPVVRSAEAVARTASVLESEDVVFAGTLCTGGEAEAVVFATAMGTQLGRIAALSQRVKPEISPLQRQVTGRVADRGDRCRRRRGVLLCRHDAGRACRWRQR